MVMFRKANRDDSNGLDTLSFNCMKMELQSRLKLQGVFIQLTKRGISYSAVVTKGHSSASDKNIFLYILVPT